MAYSKHVKIKKTIASDLKDRNEREKRFEGVVKLCNSLHESVDFLEKENLRLKIKKTKLEEAFVENSDRRGSDASLTDNAAITLQKKIHQLQLELTELHRNKGEHAQQVIDLRRMLDEKEKELAQKDLELEKAEHALRISLEKNEQFEDQASEAETNLQLMKDEYSALQLTYTSLKKNKEELEAEFKDLTARWLVYKAKAADELNAENELVQVLKQMRVQKEIEEAIREPHSYCQSSASIDASCPGN